MSKNKGLQKEQFKNNDLQKIQVYEIVKAMKNEDETDDLVLEQCNNNCKDITSKKWREILNKIKELCNKLKIKKSKLFDQYKEDVMRTVILAKSDGDGSNFKYEFERVSLESSDKVQVTMEYDKCGTLTNVKSTWKEMFGQMNALQDELEFNKESEGFTVRIPKNELMQLMKKFNSEQEKFLKGKKTSDDKDIVMSKEEGEPPVGGQAQCKWMLTRTYFQDIHELIRYAKYWRRIDERLKRNELEEAEPVPEFKQYTIFTKYLEFFIKVYHILYKNPKGVDHIGQIPEDKRFLIVPHAEILGKFMQTDFEGRVKPKEGKNEAQEEVVIFSCKYNFEKQFGLSNKEHSKLLCEHQADGLNHPIVRQYGLPLLRSIQKIERELTKMEENELWRIKLDLHENKEFQEAMYSFDKIQHTAYCLMAWNQRRDQFIFIYSIIEWLFNSKQLQEFFGEPTLLAIMKVEIVPRLVAYMSVLKYRQFLDYSDPASLNPVKPKYGPDYDSLEPNEEWGPEICSLMRHEQRSGEQVSIDKKTNRVFTIREFLLQEIIPEDARKDQEQYLKEGAQLVYDIREDVRVQIKCDIIMEIWAKQAMEGLNTRRKEEVEERKKNRKDQDKLLNEKVNKVRREGENIDNYVPYLKEFEEQNLLKENLIKQFADRLQLAVLRTPNVFNSESQKNEARFTTLQNSHNCQEDDRVKKLTQLIETHLTPKLCGNKILDFQVERIYDYFIHIKDKNEKKN